MALNWYTNYLNNIAVSAPQTYLNDMQATINAQWDNSTQTTGDTNNLYATEQTAIGSKDYVSVDVSIDMQIDLGTGQKVSDDFKIFTHKLLSDVTMRGLMYQFQDNYWISTNVDEIASPIKNVGVRRCNQVAKWIDPQTGAVISWPCVLDYDVSGPQPKYDKDINTANGHVVMIIQGNTDTLALTKNQRFIFNQQAYKLTGYNNMLQNGIVSDETTLLYFDLYVDTVSPNDDLVNNIANATEYVYTMNILQDVTEQISGFSGALTAQISLNGQIVNQNATWSANSYGTIDENGNYTLTGASGNTAIFTATFGDLTQNVSINIVSSITDQFDIVINPIISELLQGESVNISANLYKNGVIQSDAVTAMVSGADNSKCYTFVLSGTNVWTLTNNFRSIVPLSITFTSGTTSETISVQLLSIF
jgi:hypothetical protein